METESKKYTLEDLKIYQIIQPTIKTLTLSLPNSEDNVNGTALRNGGNKANGDDSKMFAFAPYIAINEKFIVSQTNIDSFQLDCTGFIPTLDISIYDRNNDLKSKYYPTDGSIISLYIASLGDEKTYRPIRLDFIVTSVDESNSLVGTMYVGETNKFTISAVLNAPKMLYNMNMYQSGSSFEALAAIAQDCGLGFASNIENTNDSQLWINGTSSIQSFAMDIGRHAYLDDESFFTTFIDPYYNLNLVEVSRLFSQCEENETCYAYQTTLTNDENAEQAFDENTLPDSEQDIKEWVGRRHKFWYELNNSKFLNAWTPYFEKYTEVNDSRSTLYTGYTKYAQYWDYNNKRFIKMPITPINPNTEGMLPLNKGKLINGEQTELVANLKTYSYNGEFNENTNPNYFYAEVNNSMNMNDISKFGLTIELPCFNPTITRYSRIKVIVFEKNPLANNNLIEDENFTENNSIDGITKLKETPEMLSSTTPRFDLSTEEGIKEAKAAGVYSELATPAGDGNPKSGEVLNESLSGWYVVTGYEVFFGQGAYDEDDGTESLHQKVYLSRREYKPALKADYMDMRTDSVNTEKANGGRKKDGAVGTPNSASTSL